MTEQGSSVSGIESAQEETETSSIALLIEFVKRQFSYLNYKFSDLRSDQDQTFSDLRSDQDQTFCDLRSYQDQKYNSLNPKFDDKIRN